MHPKTVLGIDFDNTIVCYDDIFHEVALENKLITPDFPKEKEKIRNYLRAANKEDIWTEMQGYVYGNRMISAKPFAGFIDFLKIAKAYDITVYIISHKTKHPYAGKPYDLHAAAYNWIENNGILSNPLFSISIDKIFFLESKQEKILKINDNGCTHFIDDLPEILLHPNFPTETMKILFSNQSLSNDKYINKDIIQFSSWYDIKQSLFGKH